VREISRAEFTERFGFYLDSPEKPPVFGTFLRAWERADGTIRADFENCTGLFPPSVREGVTAVFVDCLASRPATEERRP
jgi:hypothetical protein